MAEIGVVIYTDKIKERQISKGNYFDNMKYFGFRKIIKEAENAGHEIKYISPSRVNEVDFAMTSLVSYYDAYNFIYNFHDVDVKSKIIVGGAGFTNPIALFGKAWAAAWGRGEGLINGIAQGVEFPSVWYRDKDQRFENTYQIGQLQQFIEIDAEKNDETPTHMRGFKEVHIGCRKKCYFCQYTWKNELKTDDKQIGYKSGLNDCENTIAETDWSLNNPYFITAIDGATEKARRTVNRGNITNTAIKRTIERYFRDSVQKKTVLKLYCVVGYPFEEKEDVDFSELFSIVKEMDGKVDNPDGKYLQIFIQCTHFVPMPFTPMEGEPVNLIDVRGMHRKLKLDYKGKNIRCWILPYMTSNASALEQAILNRAKEQDLPILRALSSKKYQKLKSKDRVRFILKNVPERLYGRVFGPIHDFIGNPYKIEIVKNAYYKKLNDNYGIKV